MKCQFPTFLYTTSSFHESNEREKWRCREKTRVSDACTDLHDGGPLSRELPLLALRADVAGLDGHHQDALPILGLGRVVGVGARVVALSHPRLELPQELEVPRHVRRQDHRDAQLPELKYLVFGPLLVPSQVAVLAIQQAKSLCHVPVLIHALVVVQDGPLVGGSDEEVVADARVVEVVDHAGEERGEDLPLAKPQPARQLPIPQQPKHVVHHIRHVRRIVVHIFWPHLTLDHLHVLPKLSLVDLQPLEHPARLVRAKI
mmetsp:Transcript_1549/g.3493  ORF Transcript_1549/g.3493 Transcript_1549/m.3493 type:complete len:259 (-) Transcript_1549:346-1122(-)